MSQIKQGADSWAQLGTNLSVPLGNGKVSLVGRKEVDEDTRNISCRRSSSPEQFGPPESNRLLMMEMKDFNVLGFSVDDLVDAYIQSVLSVIAIDKLCCKLHTEDVSRASAWGT